MTGSNTCLREGIEIAMNVSVPYIMSLLYGQSQSYVATQSDESHDVIEMLWQMLPRDWWHSA